MVTTVLAPIEENDEDGHEYQEYGSREEYMQMHEDLYGSHAESYVPLPTHTGVGKEYSSDSTGDGPGSKTGEDADESEGEEDESADPASAPSRRSATDCIICGSGFDVWERPIGTNTNQCPRCACSRL